MNNKFFKYLSSLKFTLLVICLLGVMFLFGLWIPQESLVSPALHAQWKANSPKMVSTLEWLGFLNIYTSPTMLILWGFFFLNLSLVMWQRLPLIKKRIEVSESRITDPAKAGSFPFHAEFALPSGMDGAAVVEALRKAGYSMLQNAEGVFYGVKNRLSPIAFGLFHVSFFFILLGGLISVYTNFAGVLEIAEGETFTGEVSRYVPTPKLPKIGTPPNVAFEVRKIVPEVKGLTPTGLKVQLVDPQGGVHDTNINAPYKSDNSTFVIQDVGVAPLFVVVDPTGKEIDGAYAKLNVMHGRTDVFSLAGFHFQTKFYPDYEVKNGVADTKTQEFKNPVFVVTAERQGKVLGTGEVPLKGGLQLNGNRLVLKDMAYWVRMSVFKERGLAILYFGFAIASIAVIWRFLFYRREILGTVREEDGERRLVVAGRSEFYKSLAEDEFTSLLNKILGIPGRKE